MINNYGGFLVPISAAFQKKQEVELFLMEIVIK